VLQINRGPLDILRLGAFEAGDPLPGTTALLQPLSGGTENFVCSVSSRIVGLLRHTAPTYKNLNKLLGPLAPVGPWTLFTLVNRL